jgi:hypothetical protein
VKRTNQTVELIAVPCTCGKAVIRATVQKLSVGLMSANVPDKVHPCPNCGSVDLKGAREAEEKKRAAKK